MLLFQSRSSAPQPDLAEINVDDLDDDALFAKLKEFNVEVGPIVESTRALYKKKLAKLLLEGGNNEAESNGNGHTEDNDSLVLEEEPEVIESDDNLKKNNSNGFDHFSADDETANEEDEEDAQPAPVARRFSPRVASKVSQSNRSPGATLKEALKSALSSGDDDVDAIRNRFTPTPRRSIHSYKVGQTENLTVLTLVSFR